MVIKTKKCKTDNKCFIYPYNKQMAYISSWDDGGNELSFLKIIQLLRENKIKIPLTLFIHSGSINESNIDIYKFILSSKLHTIESHSINHKNNPNIPNEYIESQKQIKKYFGKRYGNTYCYPFGIMPTKSKIKKIIKNKYISARSIKTGYVSKKELYKLRCIPIEKINEYDITNALKKNYTIITYGHGIEGISGWNPISVSDFNKHLKLLKKYENNIWFTTLPKFIRFLRKTKQL